MIIQKNKNNELEIKTKTAMVTFDHKTRVNDVELEGAGEYEIGGISIEGVDDDIYIFQAEELILGSVNFKSKISKEHLEKLSNAEILIVRLDGEVAQAVDQANQIEPNVLIYAGDNQAKSKITSASVAFEEKDSLKITKADIGESQAYFIEVAPNEQKVH